MTISNAIIVAGGKSKRMNGIDKTFVNILDKPVIAHTLDAFERSNLISGIVLVLPNDKVEEGKSLVEKYKYKKVIAVCSGGETRQESVSKGIASAGRCDIILVHDGARPCVSQEAISIGIAEAEKEGVAIAAAPVIETIKQVDGNNFVVKTIPRTELKAVHTPQAFKAEILKKIHQNADPTATDDAVLAEMNGYKVKVYDDSYENIKITTEKDLEVAASILLKRSK